MIGADGSVGDLQFSLVSGCLDPNTPAVCSGFGLRSRRGGRIYDKSSTFLSDNPPLADWMPSMCNNIPAGRPLLRGGASVLVILVMMVAAWGGGEEGGPSVHPSKSALIKTARFIPPRIKSDK